MNLNAGDGKAADSGGGDNESGNFFDQIHFFTKDGIDHFVQSGFLVQRLLRKEVLNFRIQVDRYLQLTGRPVKFALLRIGKIVFFFHDVTVSRRNRFPLLFLTLPVPI